MNEGIFTKEDKQDLKEATEEYNKELEEENKRDSESMESVKQMVSEKVFKQIEREIEESSNGWDFEIVKKPLGDNQDYEDCEVWVNQTTNGGYSGDEFAGTCYFKIGKNKYLRWNYAM